MGQYALVYAYELCKAKMSACSKVEYLYDNSLPCYDYVEHNVRKNMHAMCLGEGTHRILYQGSEIEVQSEFAFQTRLSGDIVNRVTLSVIQAAEKEMDILSKFLKDAKQWVEKNMHDLQCTSEDSIKKYIFDPKEQTWDILNVTQKRPLESIFLPIETKDKLLKFVKHFVSPAGKADYQHFNMPYKCNVLLHGLPGTGKTSCIHAIASELNSDIGIIHFNHLLDDVALTRAMNKLADLKNCKVLVFEDVDGLFSDDRKKHDTAKNSVTLSGLLNNLDGLSRNEGTIVFMTTNRREVLDEAILRSSRVDMQVEFCNATKEQIETMFRYYFPKHTEDGDRLIKKIMNRSYTMSMLQEFFFLVRNESDIVSRLDLLEQIRNRNSGNSEKSKSMYM